jgi:acetylornithine deacetylase/succinyl-diaminopimelate desuccinylase family protein
MVNKKRLTALIKRLIRINSENPPGNEKAIALWVGGYLKRLGLKVKCVEFAKGRPNVIAVLKGKDSKKSILLSPHLDTVPAGKGWGFDPFGGVVRNGRIYGRGATDCKGNLAAAIEAMNSLSEDGVTPDIDVVLAATADEECGSELGIIPLIKRRILNPSEALILDADKFDIIVAQKGLIHFKVRLFGKKAHGAYPDRGVNAIEKAASVIQGLKKMKFRFKTHPLLKGPTVNIGTIKGGDKVNIVADYCEFEVDLRFLPGMDAGYVMSRIKDMIRKKAKAFKIEMGNVQEPYEMEETCHLVSGLKEAASRCGIRPEIKGNEGATVLTFFKKRKIPAVAFGFGSRAQAHATDEYARIDDLYNGARVLCGAIVVRCHAPRGHPSLCK